MVVLVTAGMLLLDVIEFVVATCDGDDVVVFDVLVDDVAFVAAAMGEC